MNLLCPAKYFAPQTDALHHPEFSRDPTEHRESPTSQFLAIKQLTAPLKIIQFLLNFFKKFLIYLTIPLTILLACAADVCRNSGGATTMYESRITNHKPRTDASHRPELCRRISIPNHEPFNQLTNFPTLTNYPHRKD